MLYNVPMINEASSKWQDDAYLKRRFGHGVRAVTKSSSNHFMYYSRKGVSSSALKNYKAPTSIVRMPFEEWLQKAYETETADLNDDHYYLQLNSVGPDSCVLCVCVITVCLGLSFCWLLFLFLRCCFVLNLHALHSPCVCLLVFVFVFLFLLLLSLVRAGWAAGFVKICQSGCRSTTSGWSSRPRIAYVVGPCGSGALSRPPGPATNKQTNKVESTHVHPCTPAHLHMAARSSCDGYVW